MKNFYKQAQPMPHLLEKNKSIRSPHSVRKSENLESNNEREYLHKSHCLDSYLKYLSTKIYEIQSVKSFAGDINLPEIESSCKSLNTTHKKDLENTSINVRKNKREYLETYIHFLPLMFLFLSNLFISPALAQDTAKKGDMEVYKLGDTISEEIWNKPLNLFNHPHGKEVFRFKDFKHKKLIIIDFWSTWCGTCMFTLPRTFDKLAPYANKVELIPVTTQTTETVDRVWKVSKYLQSIENFYSVVDESFLKETFAIPYFPMVVIINTKGQVLFYDAPSKINDELLNNLLDKEELI